MSFTQRLFEEVQPLLEKIMAHPFNVSLADGSLARDKFEFYMKQDSLYLIDYARALAFVGARCTRPQDINMFLQFSHGALEGERSLHMHYFQAFGINAADAAGTPKGPACTAYTGYLLEKATLADIPEAMAALLPCFWIYREVGNRIFQSANSSNTYWNWIETYASKEFSDAVDEAVRYTDELAAGAGKDALARMEEAFMMSSRLEYCFWDDAWEMRTWPI